MALPGARRSSPGSWSRSAPSRMRPRSRTHGSRRRSGANRTQRARAQCRHLHIVRLRAPRADPVDAPTHNLWGRAIDCDVLEAAPHLRRGLDEVRSTRGARDRRGRRDRVRARASGRGQRRADGLTELIESVSIIAGQHGVGRIAAIHEPTRREPFRMYEAPAAIVLHAAHDDARVRHVPADSMQLKWTLRGSMPSSYARPLVHDVREALDAFGSVVQRHVTGAVARQAAKGQCTVSALGPPGSTSRRQRRTLRNRTRGRSSRGRGAPS